MAKKLFVKLNVRLSTLPTYKIKKKSNEYYSDDHQRFKKKVIPWTAWAKSRGQKKKMNEHHPPPQRKTNINKTKTNLKNENSKTKQKISKKKVWMWNKQQWSRPDESIVFFSKMVGYYHGFFYQVYALCSIMIIINNSCKHTF